MSKFYCQRVCTSILCTFLLSSVVGCQFTKTMIMENPLTYREQVAEIEKIVVVGTHRDQAVKKLEKAGIKGSFGENKSTYYCNLWDRGKGETWQMEVALLFDEKGNYLASGSGQSSVNIATGEVTQSPTQTTSEDAATPNTPKSARAEQRARTTELLLDKDKK